MKVYIVMEHLENSGVPHDMGEAILGVFFDKEMATERILSLRRYYLGNLVPRLFFVGERVEDDQGCVYFQIIEREIEV